MGLAQAGLEGAVFMFIYLVQHGRAKTEEEDPERGLTEEGAMEAKKVGAFLSGKIRPFRIYHSGKKRAAETARILADYLRAETYAAEGLNPLDEPSIWAEKINRLFEDTMLVGHLPHLEKLASLLTTKKSERNVISFKNAGVIAIRRDTTYTLEWIVVPGLFR
jgi:phosphohistidine phosphatase